MQQRRRKRLQVGKLQAGPRARNGGSAVLLQSRDSVRAARAQHIRFLRRVHLPGAELHDEIGNQFAAMQRAPLDTHVRLRVKAFMLRLSPLQATADSDYNSLTDRPPASRVALREVLITQYRARKSKLNNYPPTVFKNLLIHNPAFFASHRSQEMIPIRNTTTTRSISSS